MSEPHPPKSRKVLHAVQFLNTFPLNTFKMKSWLGIKFGEDPDLCWNYTPREKWQKMKKAREYSPCEWQQVDIRWTYEWGVPSANNSLYRSSVCSIPLLIRTPDICTIKNTWPVRNPLWSLVCTYLNISPSPLCPPCVPSSYQCFQAFPTFYVSFTSVLLWMQMEEVGQGM